MQKKLQQSKQGGFTIIEVLIVLAIAGLIMLLVFLAVPALQRNQRNTSRKSDISRLGGAATEFTSNNNGTLPTATVGDATTILNSAGNLAEYTLNPSAALASGKFNVNVIPAGSVATVGAIVDPTEVQLDVGGKCNPTGGTVVAGQTRQMAIQYAVENSKSTATSGGSSVCTDI